MIDIELVDDSIAAKTVWLASSSVAKLQTELETILAGYNSVIWKDRPRVWQALGKFHLYCSFVGEPDPAVVKGSRTTPIEVAAVTDAGKATP